MGCTCGCSAGFYPSPEHLTLDACCSIGVHQFKVGELPFLLSLPFGSSAVYFL